MRGAASMCIEDGDRSRMAVERVDCARVHELIREYLSHIRPERSTCTGRVWRIPSAEHRTSTNRNRGNEKLHRFIETTRQFEAAMP